MTERADDVLPLDTGRGATLLSHSTMRSREECIRHAEECERKAMACGASSGRTLLLEAAAMWRRIGEMQTMWRLTDFRPVPVDIKDVDRLAGEPEQTAPRQPR